MLIIALLYVALVWLVFFQFKWLPWNWTWGTAAGVLGAFILMAFLALLNVLTPSGRIVVVGKVVEVTPNVAGTVTAIEVQPNTMVKDGTVLFRIDPAPYEAKVKQLRAGVAEAQQKVEQLKAKVDLAVADVSGLTSQVAYAEKRRDDIQTLSRTSAASEFKLQDALAQVDLLTAQLQAAKAREADSRLALGSEIEGENTTVAQLTAQLEYAEWELSQTTIRAAGDGYVSTMALSVGARAVPMRAALSYILANDTRIVGIFDQNGFRTIKTGTPVKMVFSSRPGEIYYSKIEEVVRGTGQGQLAVSGTLARTEAIGTSTAYPATIAVPEKLDSDVLRLGMVGTATAISENAGGIGMLATIMLWIKAYAAYL